MVFGLRLELIISHCHPSRVAAGLVPVRGVVERRRELMPSFTKTLKAYGLEEPHALLPRG